MHNVVSKACAVGMVVLLAVAGVTGCTQEKEKPPVMTFQQATDLVEQLIRENTAALHPTPTLEPLDITGKAPCSGPNDDQETGQIMVEHTYWLRGIDQPLNDDVFRQLRQYWSDNGYRITLESGDGGKNGSREIVARHPRNDFKVSLTEGHGVLSIGSQSSCVARPAEDLPE